MLRPYQQRSIDMLHDYLANNDGDPCLVLPTGAGKSHIIAAFIKNAVQNWPQTRVLMLTHVKELIAQNAAKIRLHWPNAPLGIYSAGLKQRNIEAITYAGIQSVRTKAALLGHQDLVLIDECHLVSHQQIGGYRTLLASLKEINPYLRVIGLTATPYRLGHGLITQGTALFDALIEPITIPELIQSNYLAPLRSKLTQAELNTAGVKKRGGEFIASQLQSSVNTDEQNAAVVQEIIRLGQNRRSWLIFCTGVEHAHAVAQCLRDHEIEAKTIVGTTPQAERDRIIEIFETGKLRALTNCDVLTTGFDAPDTDLIAFLRPTMSPGLYVQMAGRGMRLKQHIDDCLVLDFAGNVRRHGPITNVKPPKQKGEGTGEAPIKICEACYEIVHLSAKECPACGESFNIVENHKHSLDPNIDIMGDHYNDKRGRDWDSAEINSWRWAVHTSKRNGKHMLKVKYYRQHIAATPITEFFVIFHDGYPGQKALSTVLNIASKAGVKIDHIEDLETIVDTLQNAEPPTYIEYRKNGKFFNVFSRHWDHFENVPTFGPKTPDEVKLKERNLLRLERKLLAAGVTQEQIADVCQAVGGLPKVTQMRYSSQQVMDEAYRRLEEIMPNA